MRGGGPRRTAAAARPRRFRSESPRTARPARRRASWRIPRGRKRFGRAAGGGAGDVFAVGAAPLALGRQRAADVSGDVAGGQQRLARQPAAQIGQAVAQRLERFGQAGVVDAEPRVFFHDAQGFGGAIEIGVENAGDGGVHGGVGSVVHRGLVVPAGIRASRRYHDAMSDAAARIAMLLGLVLLSIATFIVSVGIIEKVADEHCARLGSACTAGLVVAFVLLVLGGLVRWTMRLRLSTAGATLVLALHFVLWLPLWRINCNAEEEVLKLGQSSVLLGIWCVGCAILWWRPVRSRQRKADVSEQASRAARDVISLRGCEATVPEHLPSRPGPARSFVRLAASLSQFPLMFGIFIIVYMLPETLFSLGVEVRTAIAFGVCLLLGMSTETKLWWSMRRRTRGWGLVPLSIVVLSSAVLVVAADACDLGSDVIAAAASIPMMAWAAWLAVTSQRWRRENRQMLSRLQDEGALREVLTCPTCTYRLTGLPVVRCPECGWNGTLGGLAARTAAACEEL